MPIRDEDGHRAMQAAGKAWKAIKTSGAKTWLPVDQVWGRSIQHGPAIANQAPHRHRQAKSGTCRGREPPHARHTCLGQPTADQGCVLRHGVDLGIAIDFGGLLNAAVGRRRLCNSSTQRFGHVLGRAGKLASRGLPRSHPSSLWRVAIDNAGEDRLAPGALVRFEAGCGRRPKSGRYRSVFATHG
jgi:hypothetical protein